MKTAKDFGDEVANAFVIVFHDENAAKDFSEKEIANDFGEEVEIKVEIFDLFA